MTHGHFATEQSFLTLMPIHGELMLGERDDG